ncbi:hypothetical protein TL16_g07317 [Triparma laevis f. inornata]|uniref:PH domain-containing protein n=1 Tax=Triparma laevis f. inornata TaxID=1714386 RepID=A0A9W7AWC8_9STRA|nr:hypothetical protein TL16_g07317 [Triparma laevis f. inornata]
MSTSPWIPTWEPDKDGSENHFVGWMVRSSDGGEIEKVKTSKSDLMGIPDFEAGRGGSYMFKKGDKHKSWSRRYFEVKQQILYYFEEPTDEHPSGVIPLDGCTVKLPIDNAQFFEEHSDGKISDCWEMWISHPHRRLFSLCAMSKDERSSWVKTITQRSKKDFLLKVSNGPGSPSAPPPGLQSLQTKKKKKKKKKDGEDGNATEDRENANTSTLRRRLSSAMTPDALKELNGGASDGKKKKKEKKETPIESWQKKRMGLIQQLVKEEVEHPMTLSFLLRGQLIATDRVMAEVRVSPHPSAKVDVPHIKGDWAGEVVISVFNRYSDNKGIMQYEHWLSFMDDIDLVNTHLGPNDDVEKFDPTAVYRRVLKLEMGDVTTRGANFPEFYTFLLVLCDRTYPDIFRTSATEAMELFLHEVIVPIYYFNMGELDHEKCASRDPLVKDGRITLLLNAYLPNLWRVFLHYAQDLGNRVPATFNEDQTFNEFGTHKPLPNELKFPVKAQASERALFEGVTHLPSMTPDQDKEEGSQVYTVHESSIIRFCEDYGILEMIPKGKVIKTYRAVVSHRFKLKGFAPPKVTVKPHPMANKTPVKGGRPTQKGLGSTIMLNRSPSPNRAPLANTAVVGQQQPAFMPVGNKSISERKRESEFRERAGSTVKSSIMGAYSSVEEALRAKNNASEIGIEGLASQTQNSGSFYKANDSRHAPHAGDIVQVPSDAAGFCEFIEVASTLAIESMCNDPHHHKLYPSAYDKILAMLFSWGVADVRRVEQAKFMWPYDKKVPKQTNNQPWLQHDKK